MLLRHEPKVQIRESDLLAAASDVCTSDGQHLMRLLFQHDATIVATEAVIIKTIQSFNGISGSLSEALPLVLEHDGGLGTTPAMVEAADADLLTKWCPLNEVAKVIKILLENKPINQGTADRLKSMSERVALKTQEQAVQKAEHESMFWHLVRAEGSDDGTTTESDPQ